MHRIPSNTLHINSMVVDDMPIETVVMPYFQVFLALEKWLINIYQPTVQPKVIYEQPWSIPEIHFRPCKDRQTDNLPPSHRNFFLHIQINSLRITCHYLVLASSHEYLKSRLSILLIHYDSSPPELVGHFEIGEREIHVLPLVEIIEVVVRCPSNPRGEDIVVYAEVIDLSQPEHSIPQVKNNNTNS